MILSAFIVFGLIAVSSARPNAIAPNNVVVVPPNCPTGQVWVNNQCRDVWRLVPLPIILPKPLVPVVPAQEYENVAWDFMQEELRLKKERILEENEPTSIISVPNQCPIGYKPDANGICRKIF